MRKMTIWLGLVLAVGGCMRETVEQATPTEAANLDRAPLSAPVSAPGAPTPTRGLLDAPQDNPEEYGAVHWSRKLGPALEQSRQIGKPVLILFTEVPGCSTVRGFANRALQHPLIVEAIEDEFVPVLIHNNAGGEDREVLKSFGEPAWNNPVVRFVDADREDLVGRYARGWTADGLAASMIDALKAAHRPVPRYLTALQQELGADRQTTVFSMYCFWTGEVRLAGLAGVVSTRPGFANGHEVVEVTWDRRRTSFETLVAAATKSDAASGVLVRNAAERKAASGLIGRVEILDGTVRFSARDDKYQIRQRPWGWVPMTPAQATAVNRAVTGSGVAVQDILSPRQLAFASSDARFDPTTGALVAPNQSR